MRIDSHQHFWKYDADRDGWIDESMEILKRDFQPAELEQALKTCQIDGCIAVQADQSEEETNYLLDLADDNEFIKGVVGWVDLQSDNVSERLGHFSERKKFKGVRHILQAESDGFMLKDQFINGIKTLVEFDLSYDILILPTQMGGALELVQQVPNQPFVLDHLGKPYVKDQHFSPWKEEIMALAKMPNVYCKVSGLITEADWSQWQPNEIYPYLDIVFEAFGIDRLMYGSDWPVCLLAGGYQRVYQLLFDYMNTHSELDKQKVFGLNAQKFYNLG